MEKFIRTLEAIKLETEDMEMYVKTEDLDEYDCMNEQIIANINRWSDQKIVDLVYVSEWFPGYPKKITTLKTIKVQDGTS